jgi:hypothetical protein
MLSDECHEPFEDHECIRRARGKTVLRGCEMDIILVNDIEYVRRRGGPEGRVAEEPDQKSCSGIVDRGF